MELTPEAQGFNDLLLVAIDNKLLYFSSFSMSYNPALNGGTFDVGFQETLNLLGSLKALVRYKTKYAAELPPSFLAMYEEVLDWARKFGLIIRTDKGEQLLTVREDSNLRWNHTYIR